MASPYAQEIALAFAAKDSIRLNATKALHSYPWLTNSLFSTNSFSQWLKENKRDQEGMSLDSVMEVIYIYILFWLKDLMPVSGIGSFP